MVGAEPRYDTAATEKWRAARETDLRSRTGWLTVSGLYFLKPGANSIGSDPASDVVLPPNTPGQAGVIDYEPAARVTLTLRDGVPATLDGKPPTAPIALLSADAPRGPAPRVSIDGVSLQVHRSGDRLAIRLRDPNSALLKSFAGLRWFPIDASWSVQARFIPYDRPKRIPTQNILGDNTESVSPGEVEFTIGGVTTRLVAFGEGRRLSFVFSDATAGRDSYRLRFLSADAPDADGVVTLDFNRAYNPPCAFNPFTTCPVPIPQNRLKVAIAAGEKAYRASSTSTSTRPD